MDSHYLSTYHWFVAKDHQNFLVLLVSFFSIVLGVLSLMTHWADTELWSITLSHQFGVGGDFSLIYKAAYNLLLKTLYFFDLSNVQTINSARFIFLIIGLGIVFQVYKIGMIIHGDKRKALFGSFLVMTSSFFLSRGFRVRSDLLACFFQLMFLISFLKFNQSDRSKWCFLGFFSVVMMLMSTPKAIFLLLVVLLFIIVFMFSSGKYDQVFKFITIALMPTLIIGIVVLVLKTEAILAAQKYFVNSFNVDESKPSYFSVKAFYFVFKFLKENPILVASMAAYTITALKIRGVRNRDPITRAFAVMFFSSLALIVLHNDRLPFYVNIMTIIPIMLCAWSLSDFLCEVSAEKKYNKAYVIILLVFFAKGGYYSERNLNNNSNTEQVEAIHYLEDYMSRYPGIKYFDGIGVFPRSNKVYHFITPTLKGNLAQTLKVMADEKPELVFFSNRMFYQMKAIMDFLKDSSYIYLGDGIYGKHDSLENLSGEKVYKYQGSFFQKLNLVEGEFDKNQKMRVFSKYAPVKLPSALPFFQIFDFDPRF